MKSALDAKTSISNELKGANYSATEVSTFRRLLPQILASTAKNFLLFDLGLSVVFPTIVIPALTGLAEDKNPDEFLHLSPSAASWFGSIAYICQPLGSIMSGWIMEPLGRKRAMFIVNIPHVIAWIMMYRATSVFEVFAANVLLGLGVGLMEAPIITYVGEICEPSIRGILTACAGIAATGGFFVVFLLGSIMPWRNVAIICLMVPLVTMIAICFVPETPLWLLSKDRTNDALKSLQWLRGWVAPKAVEQEFQALVHYNERSNSCNECIKRDLECHHPRPTILDKIKELSRKRTLKPFLLILSLFFLSQFSGIAAMRPYTVQIMKAYNVPIDANWATVIMGLLGLMATTLLLCIVRFVGKRRIYLFALATTFSSSITLGIYGWYHLPKGWSSFEKHTSAEMEAIGAASYLPLYVFCILTFCTNLSVTSLPWMMLSEVFPFKSRGFATGLAAALCYILAFVATKTYYNLEIWLSIPGATLLYAAIGVIGFIVMFFILPETENRTLEDIELHFSDNSKKITDRKIQKLRKIKAKDVETAEIPDKKINSISDIIEMNKRTPSVMGTVNNGMIVDDGDYDGPVVNRNIGGCDNRAFANDR